MKDIIHLSLRSPFALHENLLCALLLSYIAIMFGRESNERFTIDTKWQALPLFLRDPLSPFPNPDSRSCCQFETCEPYRLQAPLPIIPHSTGGALLHEIQPLFPWTTSEETVLQMTTTENPSSISSTTEVFESNGGDEIRLFGLPKSGSERAKLWRTFPEDRFPSAGDFSGSYRESKRRKSHRDLYFCRFKGCARAQPIEGIEDKASGTTAISEWAGFPNQKDRGRHEASHKPQIRCEWDEAGKGRCPRFFSRVDNMRDHVRRMHKKDISK